MTYRHDDQSEEARKHRLQEAFACHAVEGSPATLEDVEMFEMFEREGWGTEQRRAYIHVQIQREKESGITAE